MAKTPLRPVQIKFVFGKGSVKRRRESENSARFVAEQVLVHVLDDNWNQFKSNLTGQIESDVEFELAHLASDFKRHIMGLGGKSRRPTGTLTSVTKGEGQPSVSLSAAYGQDWIPRSAKYLNWKRKHVHNIRWFNNSGYSKGGLLRRTFTGDGGEGASPASRGSGGGKGGSFGPSGGFFEDAFGPVSVEIVKNRSRWGLDTGSQFSNAKSSRAKYQIHYATVRVRALGSITDSMMSVSNNFNAPLMTLVRKKSPEVANRLGGRSHYRPTLEPFLEFFLHKALPFAVSRRIQKGTLSSSIIRGA